MLRYVIFDFGQVLVHFNPHAMCAHYLEDPDDIREMETVLFDRLYWDGLDAGTITDEQAIAAAVDRLPAHLRETAPVIFRNWIYMLPEIDGMRELLSDLTSRGVTLGLLSNISRYFADHAHEIPILSFFEHRVFSAVCGMTKPDRAIFAHACTVFDMKPQETVFVDDSEINIRGAAQAGLTTYHFDGDVVRLRQYLTAQGLL